MPETTLEKQRTRVRDTSIAAYNALRYSGQLSARRWEIYELVYNHGPATSAEIIAIQLKDKQVRTVTQSRARFTELREMGVLQELGTVECKVTGHRAILWDVTSSANAAAPPKRTNKSEALAMFSRRVMKTYSELVDRHGDLVDLANMKQLEGMLEGILE